MHWLRDLAPGQQPRERLMSGGAAALSDAELVAILLRTGARGRDALSLAHQILAEAGGLAGLARLETAALLTIPGIGPAKATALSATVELAHRVVQAELGPRTALDTPARAAAVLLPRLGQRRVEVAGILTLDHRHRLLHCRELVRGTRTSAPVDPGELFRTALLDGAAAILLFHNHPSGDRRASDDDLALTRRLAAAGETLGVPLLDHLIIAGGSWLSLRTSHPDLFAAPSHGG